MTDHEQITQIELLKQEQKTMNSKIDKLSKDMEKGFEDIKNELRQGYVTKIEFNNVKAITYGAVGIILVSFLGFLLGKVWQ